MLCWSGRRNECEPCGLSKNHKDTLSILIIILSIVIHTSEINSHNIHCVLN